MSKIEEIVSKVYDIQAIKANGGYIYDLHPEELEELMKEYAEVYARKCLMIAANDAQISYEVGDYHFIDRDSITNITLPEHD